MARFEKKKRERKQKHQQAHAIVPREALEPRSEAQRAYITSIRQNVQTIALGPAGSGKTFIASTLAADALLDRDVRKIILCRPAVEVEESHGFLPGSIGEKMAPWVKPFTDVLEKRIGKADFRRLVNEGSIEIVPFAFMRGLTFDDSFIILDEAQNATVRQMKLFLTRIGENVRVVINGDLSQTDIQEQSGLEVAVTLANKGWVDAGLIRFGHGDIVRSATCEAWTRAFEKFEAANAA